MSPRQWDVFPGRPVSKDEQITITDTALGGDLSTDTAQVDLTTGPQTINLTINDRMGNSDQASISELNRYTVSVNDVMGMADSRTAVKNGGSSRRVIYGSSLGGKTWAQINNMLGGVPALRNYSPGTGGFARFNSNSDLQAALASGHTKRFYITSKGASSDIDSVSGKSRWTAADLEAWWGQSSFPSESSGIEIYAGYWHEPIDDWASTALQSRYRTLQQEFADYIHLNGPSNVKVTGPCWQTAELYKTGTTKFNLWHPGVDGSGIPYYDYNSLDGYSRVGRSSDVNVVVGGQTQYAGYQYYKELFIDPRVGGVIGGVTDLGWEAYIANHPSRTGRWLIGEFASGIAGIDTKASGTNYTGPDDAPPTSIRTGWRRSEWLQDMVDAFNARSDTVEAIFYWSSDGALGTYYLDAFGDVDTPDVWANACASTRAFYGW